VEADVRGREGSSWLDGCMAIGMGYQDSCSKSRGGGFALCAKPGTRLPAGRSFDRLRTGPSRYRVLAAAVCRPRSRASVGFRFAKSSGCAIAQLVVPKHRLSAVARRAKEENTETPGARREALSARGVQGFGGRRGIRLRSASYARTRQPRAEGCRVGRWAKASEERWRSGLRGRCGRL
jgi:hypothetical protein